MIWYKEAVKNGCCGKCRQPIQNPKITGAFCDYHYQQQRKYQNKLLGTRNDYFRERREKFKKKGICQQCWSNKADKGVKCVSCYEYNLEIAKISSAIERTLNMDNLSFSLMMRNSFTE